jgi:adenylate cyclase class IV
MSKIKAEHRELEVKLAADGMNIKAFKDWCFDRDPSKYLHVTGPDVYYTQGKNVLRHRQPGQGGPGELTVKRRTSKKSTRDRLEIDLKFADIVNIEDVGRFLTATGWKQKFTVIKDCHIFWFEDRVPGVEAVLYSVRCVLPNGKETRERAFVEFEIHKTDSHHPRALTTLKDWENSVRKTFDLGEPLNESLYEIYSGAKYGMVRLA